MYEPEYIREAIRAAKEALALEAEGRGSMWASVAFIDGYDTKTTPMSFEHLAILVEAVEEFMP